jgi:hypothetical protein
MGRESQRGENLDAERVSMGRESRQEENLNAKRT